MARQVGLNPFGLFLLALMLSLLYLASRVTSQLDYGLATLVGLGLALSIAVFLEMKLAIYLLIFSMLLSPEFGVGGLGPSEGASGRGVTFRLDDILLVVLGTTWFLKSALYKELGILKQTPLNGAMILYIGACAVSTLMGIADGRVAMLTGPLFVVKYVQYFVLFFVVINHIDSTKDVHRYWIAVVLTAVIVGTVGLAQIPSGARVTAPFEGTQSEPNTFAGYLAFVFLICLAMALGLPQHRHRIIYFFCGLLFVGSLFVHTVAGRLYRYGAGTGCGDDSQPSSSRQLRSSRGWVVPRSFSHYISRNRARKGCLHLDPVCSPRARHFPWLSTGYLHHCSLGKF